MSVFDTISDMTKRAKDDTRNFPPTLVYNEGWMMRLILEWFKNNPQKSHSLSIPSDCKWYSEALLPSPFLYVNGINEGYTHADGVAGKFEIGKVQKGELSLTSDCDLFYVAEAKMGSPLAAGTKNAPTYNQAARNVACIADLLVRSKLTDASFCKLAFFVLMPNGSKHIEVTRGLLKPDEIERAIEDRLKQFPEDPKPQSSIDWLRDHLHEFVHDKIEINLLFWEDVLSFISEPEYDDFYEKCKLFNQ